MTTTLCKLIYRRVAPHVIRDSVCVGHFIDSVEADQIFSPALTIGLYNQDGPTCIVPHWSPFPPCHIIFLFLSQLAAFTDYMHNGLIFLCECYEKP